VARLGPFCSGRGEWYSHPAAGECTGTARVGDGSGCTWRVVATSRAINASCMYAHLDANVEAKDPVARPTVGVSRPQLLRCAFPEGAAVHAVRRPASRRAHNRRM
jgi:hypothetical protein